MLQMALAVQVILTAAASACWRVQPDDRDDSSALGVPLLAADVRGNHHWSGRRAWFGTPLLVEAKMLLDELG